MGNQFQVNAISTDVQANGVVAALPGGGYVIVWLDARNVAVTGNQEIWGRIFDAQGLPVSNQDFVIAGNDVDNDFGNPSIVALPATASLPNGGYLVMAAETDLATGAHNLIGKIMGVTEGQVISQFVIASDPSGNHELNQPTGAVFADGSFVVAWFDGPGGAGSNIMAQRYDVAHNPVHSDGTTAGLQAFTVNATSGVNINSPDATALTNGRFVVTFEADTGDANGTAGNFAVLYNSNGTIAKSQFELNSTLVGNQTEPAITALGGGGFVASWASSNQVSGSSLEDVYLSTFDSAGTLINSEILVDTFTTGVQRGPTVTALKSGGFLVVWNGQNDTPGATDSDIYGQQFDASGAKVGTNFKINQNTGDIQFTAAGGGFHESATLLQTASGPSQVVVTWAGKPSADFEVFARQLTIHAAPVGANETQTILENQSFTFQSAADFGFSDPVDNDTFAGIVVTTLPVTGALTNHGSNVLANTLVSAADIAGGFLKFTPAANTFGSPYGSFAFKVEDNGGTAEGSGNLSVTPNTFTFNVTQVNQPPFETLPTPHSVKRGGTLAITGVSIGDVDSVPNVDVLKTTLSVSHGTLNVATNVVGGLTPADIIGNGAGTVVLNGTLNAVNATLAAPNGLSYQGASNFRGLDSLVVSVDDNGHTGVGGPLTTSSTLDIPIFTIPRDFIGDGRSDLLLSRADGAVVIGEIVNGQETYTPVATLDPGVQFEGTGDYLGDGKNGFLTEDAAGAVVVHEVSNGQTLQDTQVAQLGSEWKFVGAGNFLGHGYDDFLIENTAGAVVVGEVVNGQAQLTQVAALGSEWKFVGTGDFLGNGHDDFLIENTAGTVDVGEIVNGQAQFTQVAGLGPEWKFVGTGNFLGDGGDDFLIENTAGATVVGDVVNGLAQYRLVAGLGPEWSFIGTGDYLGAGNGSAGFMIENTAGAVVLGTIPAIGPATFAQVGGLGSEWTSQM